MSADDTVQRLIDDLRAEGHELFAERLEALRERQTDLLARYSQNQRQMIDALKASTPIILDATAGMRRGV